MNEKSLSHMEVRKAFHILLLHIFTHDTHFHLAFLVE